MSRNSDVSIPARAWTQLTSNDVTAIRVTNISGGVTFLLKATVGASAPTDRDGAIPLAPGATTATDLTLAQLFPGTAGANRVYAYAQDVSSASVSHA